MRRLALVSAFVAVCAASLAQAGASTSITGRVVANPLSAAVIGPTDPVKPGKKFEILATVSNAGAAAMRDVEVGLVRDPAIALYDPATQMLDRIGPGGTKKVVWSACSATPGSYVLLVRATDGPFTAESPGSLVIVLAGRQVKC